MNPIRPSALPQTPPPAQAEGSAKLSAQRAFFAAAMGQAQAPAVAPRPAAAAAAAPVTNTAGSPEAPQRILRPGSLIDIRV